MTSMRTYALGLLWCCLGLAGAGIFFGSTAGAQSSGVIVSEIMPANKTGLTDADGEISEWIELENTSTVAVNLEGWSLSDSSTGAGEYVLPSRTLAPGQRLVVFASGKYRFGAGELHTNFKFDSAGDGIWLFDPAGTAVSGFDFGLFAPDTAIGAQSDGRLLVFSRPTPGAANSASTLAPPRRPEFTVERGFYDAPFRLPIKTDPATTLHYTTDGSTPTAASPTVNNNTAYITRTMSLRVVAIGPSGSSQVGTSTYVFVDQVLDQPTMDPALLARYGRAKVRDALLSVPSVSISTPNTLVDEDYVGASLEWLDPAGGDTFQIDAGGKVYGDLSLLFDKKNMRFKFTREWGAPKLKFDLFENFATAEDTNGIVPTDSFDQIQLRNGSQDSQFRPPFNPDNFFVGWRGLHVRNALADDTMLTMGIANPHSRFVHVYENGVYDGMYQLRERFDSDFMSSYYGRDSEDYTAVNSARAFDGNQAVYDRAVATTTWAAISRYWNTKGLGDYALYLLWNDTRDIFVTRNWTAAGPNTTGVAPKWIFHNNDMDYGLGHYFEFNREPVQRAGPNNMLLELDKEMAPDWRMTMQQALWDRLLSPDALLAPGGAHRRYFQERIAQVESPIWAEGVRWGVNDWLVDVHWKGMIDKLEKGYTIPATAGAPAVQLGDWWTERQKAVSAWVKAKYGFVYPPSLSSCCVVSSGQALTLTPTQSSGAIWYTVDGSDPRVAGGGVKPGALGGQARPSVTLSTSTVVTARVFDGTNWSPLVSWDVSVKGTKSPVILNEWNAVPGSKLIESTDTSLGVVGGNGGDWFELVVVEDRADLRGYRLALSQGGVPGAELVFSNASRWASLRSGTIITVAEDIATDVSYAPAAGDWTINVQATDGGPSTYITASNFAVSDDDWTVTIKNRSGAVVFGPAGEGVNGVAGVGSDETGELSVAPSADVALSAYDDSSQSTFGAPNVIDDVEQDFSALRSVVAPPLPDVDANGVVDDRDVEAILRFDLGLGTPANLSVGDIDRDTKVTLRDALRLAQCVAAGTTKSCTVP